MGAASIKELSYKVSRPVEYVANPQSISMCYMPIIGVQALSFYNFLINDSDIQANIPSVRFMHSRIAQSIGIAPEQIETLRARLEGMGLLSTYIDGRDPAAPVIFYELRQPLGVFSFIDTPRYRALLEQKIGAAELERTFFALRQSAIPGSAVNVSNTFDHVFAPEIITRAALTAERLEQYVYGNANLRITIGTACMEVINGLYTSGKVTIDQAAQLVCRSSARIDGELVVQGQLLAEKIAAMTDFESIPVADSSAVVRDRSLFEGGCEAGKMLQIINGYKQKNAELFLSQLQSSPLSCRDRELLNKLRIGFRLPDEIINVMVDYSTLRCKGRLSADYLTGVAKSINMASVHGANEAVVFFRDILAGKSTQAVNNVRRPITAAKVMKNGNIPAWVSEYDPAKGQTIS